jgi:hypothetical protein
MIEPSDRWQPVPPMVEKICFAYPFSSFQKISVLRVTSWECSPESSIA